MKSLAIVLLLSTAAAQEYLNDGVLYYGTASSTTAIAQKKWCDNPGSFCDVDNCCGIGIPDGTTASNTA